MADERTFQVTLSPQQMDFVGKLVVDVLNAASAQAKMATEVYGLLRTSVQAAPEKPAALQVVQAEEAPAG